MISELLRVDQHQRSSGGRKKIPYKSKATDWKKISNVRSKIVRTASFFPVTSCVAEGYFKL
jgi:hypothetical protein